jgi:hypothetical protein
MDAAEHAIAIARAFQEEFTTPSGGTHSQRTRALVRTPNPLSTNQTRSDPCQHQQP